MSTRRNEMKKINVDAEGYIDATNLDDIEINIIDKFTKGVKGIAFQQIAIKAIGESLGFELTPGAVIKPLQREDKPFHWLDLRFGSGKYAKTPEVEDEKAIRFIRRAGKLDETDQRRREKAEDLARRGTTRHYGAMADYFTIPDEGWPELYFYELDPSCEIPQLHRDMLQVFLPGSGYSNGSRFYRYFHMHINACAELARRLGMRPVFDDYITPD
jgi:hypothetical protein